MDDGNTYKRHLRQQPTPVARRKPRRRSRLIRPMFDAAVAASVFLALTVITTTSEKVHAHPISAAVNGIDHLPTSLGANAVTSSKPASVFQISTASDQKADAVFRRTGKTAAWALLGLSLSFLVALDLFFFRHLRRVYTSRNRQSPAAE